MSLLISGSHSGLHDFWRSLPSQTILRFYDASSFFNHCHFSEEAFPWIIKRGFPTPSSLILLWTSNAIAKHSTKSHLRHLKSRKPESQGSRNHLFHAEQSSLTSGIATVQAHWVLVASLASASQGSAVQMVHSTIPAVGVRLDQAQI